MYTTTDTKLKIIMTSSLVLYIDIYTNVKYYIWYELLRLYAINITINEKIVKKL